MQAEAPGDRNMQKSTKLFSYYNTGIAEVDKVTKVKMEQAFLVMSHNVP